MSGPRLTFLWPVLYRSIGVTEHSLPRVASGVGRRSTPKGGGYSTSRARRRPESFVAQRYGTANEPPPHVSGGILAPPAGNETVRALPQPTGESSNSTAQPSNPPTGTPNGNEASASTESAIKDEDKINEEVERTKANTALSTILQMAPPLSQDSQKPPHLRAPPYVHHFDTHTLVRSLKDGGFTEEQAVTVMKAVRGVLADNMDLAQEGLVSKADAEMESYVFRAASSELRTEIQNNRRRATDKMRTERAQLQHEFDILSQRLSGESSNLKDDLKGMFDDRKMASRMEQRKMENHIQEINYKITVALNSDTRSEVEGLRWVLTRRTAVALVTIAFMVLTTLRYASFMEQKQKSERDKMERQQAAQQGSFDYDGPATKSETLKKVAATDPTALVSLG